ncbi:MAG: flagellar basal body P-ring formation protein FlgA [Ignavibacteria bacterium]|nr:flagellar basal body P-ring formation protein FlgA [Ignavibacteria bacterium]
MILFFFLWFVSEIQFSVISFEEIQKTVERFVFQEVGLPKEDVTVEFRNTLSNIRIEKKTYQVNVVPDKNIIFRGKVTLPVEIVSEGKTEKRILVSLNVRRFANVCSPSRLIAKGEILSEHDILVRKIETTSITQPFYSIKEECISKRATKSLLPGKTLLKEMLEEIPIVLKGKTVRVIAKTPTVSISTFGEAQQDGSRNEIISVRLSNSKELVKVKILDDSSVLVIQ